MKDTVFLPGNGLRYFVTQERARRYLEGAPRGVPVEGSKQDACALVASLRNPGRTADRPRLRDRDCERYSFPASANVFLETFFLP